jgi:hypothetical protein
VKTTDKNVKWMKLTRLYLIFSLYFRAPSGYLPLLH